jgi:CHAT domain-containing protein
LRLAKRLFEWLVVPYATELERQRIDTMVVVSHGVLRGVPMAALYDGNSFLIERYAVAVIPGLGLVDPQPLDRTQMSVLLGGLSSSVQGFSALPKVRQELHQVQKIFGGQVLLDKEFNLDRLRAELVEQQPSIVHLASHAQFTGEPQSSFILTSDGRLTVDRIESFIGASKFRKLPLELLVLSACETAAGDDRAALGLAGIAIRAGARSALGSLWSISDEAAAELISKFYQQLQDPRNSKAAALRAAQIGLLKQPRFSHPFFWSPFLLISNWL